MRGMFFARSRKRRGKGKVRKAWKKRNGNGSVRGAEQERK